MYNSVVVGAEKRMIHMFSALYHEKKELRTCKYHFL
eukprot:UN23004